MHRPGVVGSGSRSDASMGIARSVTGARQTGRAAAIGATFEICRHCRAEPGDKTLDKQEITKLQAYMRLKFKLPEIRIVARPKKNDSAEVFIGEEFIGVIYRDDEDGELSWNFQMAILEMDIDG